MVNWSTSQTLKALKGFSGLTSYYCKFIRQYYTIAKPLTDLLKKATFQWNPEAEQAFRQLKKARTSSRYCDFQS